MKTLIAILLITLICLACADDNPDDTGNPYQAQYSDDDDDFDDFGDDDTGDDDDPDGTWVDPATGYMWQNPPSYNLEWDEARELCEALDLAGFQDWRLPTISELRSLIRGCPQTETGGECGVTDGCLDMICFGDNVCDNCGPNLGPGTRGRYWPEVLGGEGWEYWTASMTSDLEDVVWLVKFGYGRIGADFDDNSHSARCVR